ncbi:MAG TPA: DMT family transporter [Candidatus Baltobacteraceae bacterium]
MQLRRILTYLGLLYAVSAWALNSVILKHALIDFDPLALTGLRFLAMTPLALALAKLRGERLAINRRDLPLLIACAACGYGVYQYLWIVGLAHTTAFASALLLSLTPILTLAIVAVAGHERVHAGRWFGAALAIAGVAVFEGVFSGQARVGLGDTLTFAAALVFAFYNVLSAKLLGRYSPVSLLAVTMCIGTIMILPGAVPALLHQNFTRVTPADWGAFAYAVLFPILLTYPVWSYGISQLGAGRTSLFQFLLPILAGVFSVVILGTHIAVYQILGIAVCIAGMALSQLLGRFSLTALWAQRTLPVER